MITDIVEVVKNLIRETLENPNEIDRIKGEIMDDLNDGNYNAPGAIIMGMALGTYEPGYWSVEPPCLQLARCSFAASKVFLEDLNEGNQEAALRGAVAIYATIQTYEEPGPITLESILEWCETEREISHSFPGYPNDEF